jgi:hypothetical protein
VGHRRAGRDALVEGIRAASQQPPASVPAAGLSAASDLNHEGRIDAKDLKLLGVASNIVTVPFRINGAPAQP